jgi:hypothetical protein
MAPQQAPPVFRTVPVLMRVVVKRSGRDRTSRCALASSFGLGQELHGWWQWHWSKTNTKIPKYQNTKIPKKPKQPKNNKQRTVLEMSIRLLNMQVW